MFHPIMMFMGLPLTSPHSKMVVTMSTAHFLKVPSLMAIGSPDLYSQSARSLSNKHCVWRVCLADSKTLFVEMLSLLKKSVFQARRKLVIQFVCQILFSSVYKT